MSSLFFQAILLIVTELLFHNTDVMNVHPAKNRMINSLLFYDIPEFPPYNFWSNRHSSELAKDAVFKKYKIYYYLDISQ